ncbi:MAG: hypothetical protein WBM50_05920, partial [Acidimicrobiales bacterium]
VVVGAVVVVVGAVVVGAVVVVAVVVVVGVVVVVVEPVTVVVGAVVVVVGAVVVVVVGEPANWRNCWLVPPWHDHCRTWAPASEEAPSMSRQRPDPTDRMVETPPAVSMVNC